MRLRPTLRSSVVARTVLVGLLIALLQLAVAPVFAAGEAAGHVRIHASVALVVLVLGGLIVLRWPAAGFASRAPALGLLAFGAAQLVESVGAYGFDAMNDARINVFAIAHDAGADLSAPGLILAVLGVAIGLLTAANRLPGRARPIGLALTAGATAGGFVLVKTMIGL